LLLAARYENRLVERLTGTERLLWRSQQLSTDAWSPQFRDGQKVFDIQLR